MLVRIVKMEFQEALIDQFIQLFEERKKYILSSEGCTKLELMRDHHDPSRFFTISYWESDENLQKYRNSELFSETWTLTKQLFRSKAEAWSLDYHPKFPA